MKNKLKAIASLLLMATSLFVMIDTKHFNAVGDTLLKSVGIAPWTGDHTGIHMTVIYFGIVFLLSFPLVRIFFMARYKKSLSHVLVILAILITGMTQMTEMTINRIKADSDGVYSIEYLEEGSYFEYSYDEGKLIDLVVLFTLKNHSQEDRDFKVSLDSNWMRNERDGYIKILNKDGSFATFNLHGKEEETFAMTLLNYNLSDNRVFTGRGGGEIKNLIIEDANHRIKLSDDYFFGLELVR